MRFFKHLTWTDRLKLEAMVKADATKTAMANALHVSRSTIYRELERGRYVRMNTDLTECISYSPDIAEAQYREMLSAKGPDLKIGHDHKLAKYIEDQIADNGKSPDAVIGEIKKDPNLKFDTNICTRTVYNYIRKDVFNRLTQKQLPMGGEKKRKYDKVKKAARPPKGDSIEDRPPEIEKREIFGHWEMDTVVGKKGGAKNVLLVMTERKTRFEIIRRLSDKTTASVVKAINGLERKCGAKFKDLFKTITVDNGCEFQDFQGIQNSVLHKGERTHLYFCHPYSSYERGSNENCNRLVRRKFPKGTDFGNVTNEQVKEAARWINNYPRKLFDYKSAREMFYAESGLILS